MTKQELRDFMSRYPLVVLATAGPSGQPQTALMRVLVTDELELFFDTRTGTRKYANFLANPSCSFVIGCAGPASIQFEGVLSAPEGKVLASLKNQYFAASPASRERESWPDLAWLIARPRWIRYSDYSQRPPRIEEFTF